MANIKYLQDNDGQVLPITRDSAVLDENGVGINNSYQKKLISGTNIATINNQSLLNGGNISLSELGAATKSEVSELAGKIDKLPTGRYYGQYDNIENLPDTSQLSEKGYAYVSSTDPNVYYIYLYEGDGEEWQDSGNKFVTTELESNLTTKSQTKAPTTKAVVDGIEAIDVTLARSAEDENELTKAQKYNASANINNRAVVVDQQTSEVKAFGYKVLNPSLSFAEQVESTQSIDNSNMIFEIRDEFNLDGDDIIIPVNSTLLFKGGRIIGNGTITFNNTTISGDNPCILTNVGGTISGDVYLEWFGLRKEDSSFDNGPIINKICSTFVRTRCVRGVVYFKTPIILENFSSVFWDCNLVYNGSYCTAENKEISAITFSLLNVTGISNTTRDIYIWSLNNNITTVDNTSIYINTDENDFLNPDTDTRLLIGITFESINNSNIKIGRIAGFNENIRISSTGTSPKGNSYNDYAINVSYNSNCHVHFYNGGNNGWTNGNSLHVERFNSSGFTNYYQRAIVTSIHDNGDSTNNLTITKSSMEAFPEYCCTFKNTTGVIFNGGRAENSGIAVVKCIGVCSNINFSTDFLLNTGKYIDTVSATKLNIPKNAYEPLLIFSCKAADILNKLYPITFIDSGTVEFTHVLDDPYLTFRYGNYFKYNTYGRLEQNTLDENGDIKMLAGRGLQLVFTTNRNKIFRVSCPLVRNSISLVYLDTNNSPLDNQASYGPPISSLGTFTYANTVWSSSTGGNASSLEFIFKIPDNVNRVLLISNTANFDLYCLDSKGPAAERNIPLLVVTGGLPHQGTSSGRPIAKYTYQPSEGNPKAPGRGFKYYDTTLNKYIVYDGRVWRDLLGEVIVDGSGSTTDRCGTTLFPDSSTKPRLGYQYKNTDTNTIQIWSSVNKKWINMDGSIVKDSEGLKADRPEFSTSPKPRYYQYYATDEAKYYYFNGSTWNNF